MTIILSSLIAVITIMFVGISLYVIASIRLMGRLSREEEMEERLADAITLDITTFALDLNERQDFVKGYLKLVRA